MSTTGQRSFDRTIQQTNTWLREISEAMEDTRRPAAYHALRGALFALRDRLPPNEVFDLSAQLPMLIRGLFFEGYRPSDTPDKFGADAFLQRVRDELNTIGGGDAEAATRAVFSVLSRHVGAGEIRDIRSSLPDDLRRFWPAPVNE